MHDLSCDWSHFLFKLKLRNSLPVPIWISEGAIDQEGHENYSHDHSQFVWHFTYSNSCINGFDCTKPWELSYCTENQVIVVRNQMEQAFPLEMFRKKRNTFTGIALFLFYRNYWKITIPFALSHVPWWNAEFMPATFAVANCRTQAFIEQKSTLCIRNMLVPFHFVWEKIVLFFLVENYHRLFHANESAPFLVFITILIDSRNIGLKNLLTIFFKICIKK